MRPAWHARAVRYASVLLIFALAGWEPFRAHDADVEDGNDAVAAGRYDDAVKDYGRARGRVDAGGLDYDVGTALLRQADAEKDPAKQAKLREQGLKDLESAAASAADPRVRAQAAYNRGNALFSDDKLEPAIEAYKQALKANPDFEDARLNLELALRHRKKEKQQQQQQQNGQGQGQQGQQGQNQQGQGGGQGQQQQQQQQQNGQGQGQQGQQGQNPQNGQQGQQGQNPQNGQQGQNGQSLQNPQGNGQNQSPQNQNGQGQNGQNQPQNGNPDPNAQNQQAPKPKLPNGQGSGPRTQEKTPDDGNLDQLEGESRDQRRNQAARRSNETYHPTEPEDW